LESFEAEEKAEKPRFALETFHERKGSAGDIVVAAITLLKALEFSRLHLWRTNLLFSLNCK